MTNPKKEAKRRDNNRCQKCGYKPSSTSNIHAHHIVPKAEGGDDSVDNIVTLCSTCHDWAPHPHSPIDDYEAAFDSFVNTGMKPQFDMVYFGALAAEQWGIEPEEIRDVLRMSTKVTEGRPRFDDSVWLGMAFSTFDETIKSDADMIETVADYGGPELDEE